MLVEFATNVQYRAVVRINDYDLKGATLKSPANTLAINAVELGSAIMRYKVGATHSVLT